MKKKAILLVSVGSSETAALTNTIMRLKEEVETRFADSNCYLAFSSPHILKKMKEHGGESFFSLEQAFAKMKADGMEELVVQPTTLLNGLEQDRILEQLETWKHHFAQVQIGRPLLSTKEDYKKTLQAVFAEAALSEDEALMLVGHGSSRLADSAYQNLEYTAYTSGYRQIFVGTMEGEKSKRMTLRKLSLLGYQKVCLMPLLFIGGYHARKDIFSDSASWKSFLSDAGYDVRPKLLGLGELSGIRSIFLEHLEAARKEEA